MNLESGETQRFAADDGQKIRVLGFINEDFVYGMANDSDWPNCLYKETAN